MHLTMFGIPVALEAFKASKGVLVRRPAPPGIRPFLENKRCVCAADKKYQTTGSRRDTHHGYYKGLSSTGTSRMCIKALRERNL